MQKMKYLFYSIILLTACRNETQDAILKTRLNEAILQKNTDSIAYFQFKVEHAGQFESFDSLSKLNLINPELQKAHDSLLQLGISLSMKYVKGLLKINGLKKQLE
jgi:hypothetical protein